MLVLLFAAVLAADVNAPDIVHAPSQAAPRFQELVIEAEIVDDTEVFEPVVQLRLIGDAKYQPFRMETKDRLHFRALIPALKVERDIEYFIEAFDTNGNGPSRSGTPSRPYHLRVVDLPAQPFALELPPAPEIPADPAPKAHAPPPAQAATPTVAPTPPALPLGPLVTAGVGAVALVAGLVVYGLAAGDIGAIDANYSAGEGRNAADAAATRAAQDRSQVGSVVAITGAAAVAGGVAWWLAPTFAGGRDGGASGVAVGVSAGVAGSF